MKFQTSIIIIEDNICIAYAMSGMLKRWGYTIQGVYRSAEEGWKEIIYRPPDLVLLNMHLDGEMNGIEMIYRIRTRFHIPIILVSGVLLSELPALPEEVNLLPKPFLSSQLKRIVAHSFMTKAANSKILNR